MFPERVKSVTLDKSRITYYLQTQGRVQTHAEYPINPELYQVEDLAFDCSVRSNQYLPDYAIKGYFTVDENLQHPVFIENTNGPHLLYITGIPRNLPEVERNRFRFQEHIWLSYWEDKHIGYLFQVVTREQALTHLINPITYKIQSTMKTQEYVKQFKLDREHYNFNREKFMEAFGQEFKDRIEATITACKKMQVQFTYEKFLHAIKEQQDKFWNISNKKVGEPFSEGLFSAFFALHVIPLRASLFPNIHTKLEKKKAIERYAKIKVELEAAEKERQEREKKMEPVVNALMTYAVAKSLAKQSKQVGNKPKGKK